VFAASRPCSLLFYHFILLWFVCVWWCFVFCFIFVLLLHPPSFSPSLVFVSTIFWHIFTHSHSSLGVHADDPSDPSAVCISALSGFLQCVALTPQAGHALFSCGCRSPLGSLLSMLPPAHPAGSHHQSSHDLSLLCCLRTRSPRSLLAFPLLL